MRRNWTKTDIVAGMYIIRCSSMIECYKPAYAASVSYKIGWSPKGKGWGKISFFTDGMYIPIADNRQELADYLNNDRFGYRFLTRREFRIIHESTNQGFYENKKLGTVAIKNYA